MNSDGRIPGEQSPAQAQGNLERRLEAVERGDHLAHGPVRVGSLAIGEWRLSIETDPTGAPVLTVRNPGTGLTYTTTMLATE